MAIEFSFDISTILASAMRSGVSRQSALRAVANRTRPRLNDIAHRVLPNVMRYKKLGPFFRVRQETSGDEMYWYLVNTHPAAQFLLASGGTVAHTISQRAHWVPRYKLQNWATFDLGLSGIEAEWTAQVAQAAIARRGVVIEHPGTEEDTEMWMTLEDYFNLYEQEVAESMSEWIRRWGQI